MPDDQGVDAGNHGSSLAGGLARWAAALQPRDLSAAAQHAAARAYLDWLGSVAAGADTPPAQMARAILPDGPPEASVFGERRRLPAAAAAFANGVAGHVVEMDDLHRPSTFHPAAPIIPAALALAERERVGGAELLTAIAAGFEIGCRIGEAGNPAHYRFFHTTGTAGCFGATAAAAHVLGLPAEVFAHALGSAGTLAAGLWEFNADGAMSKHLHTGHAAQTGVQCADLAAAGFTGASRILEGERGFFNAMADTWDPEPLKIGAAPARLRIEEDSFKIHPCCGHTHTGVDLACEWAAQCDPDSIESIDLATYQVALDVVGNRRPETPYQAKFSYAYCVAHALRHGRLDQSAFTPDAIADPATHALMARVQLHHEPAFDQAYPASYPVRVRLTLRDGGERRGERAHAKGSPENPISDAEMKAKVAALLGCARAERLAEHAFGLWSAAQIDSALLVAGDA